MVAPTDRPSGGDRLDSWKEIAAYLGREVRTVQGWEKTEGLPVHRHQHARQGSVYAFRSELDCWREARRIASEPSAGETVLPEAPPAAGLEDPASVPALPVNRHRRWRVVAAAVCGVAVLGLAGWWWTNRLVSRAAQTPSSVVVLPFLDLSPQKDQEYFSDG